MSVVKKAVKSSSAKVSKKSTKAKAVKEPTSAGVVEKYELMVILRSMLSEDARAEAQKKLQQIVAKAGGEITNTDVWGKRHLAYKLKGQNEGYYIVYRCGLNKANTKAFEQSMKLSDDILRYLLIKESDL